MEHESESFCSEISEHFGFTASKDFKILVKQLADLEFWKNCINTTRTNLDSIKKIVR